MDDNQFILLTQHKLGLPDKPKTSSGELIYTCPICGKKAHLYISPKEEKFICFKCDSFRGSLNKLLMYLGIEKSDIVQTNISDKFLNFKLQINSLSTNTINTNKCTLPIDTCNIIPNTLPHKYLLSRYISDEDIEYYKIQYSPSLDRIIIPSYTYSTLDCWVGRKISNTYRAPKYLFSPGIDKNDKLFDIKRIRDNYNTIVIAEGTISAIAAGKNATCTYGKSFSDTQITMLSELNFDKYIIAYDGDTQVKFHKRSSRASLDLAKALFKKGVSNIYIVKFNYDEDPASIRRDDIKYRIDNAKKILPPGIIIL